MSVQLNTIVKEDISSIISQCDFSPLAGCKVLVTGANGHIASYLALTLAEVRRRGIENVEVTVLSRNRENMLAIFGEYIVRGDIKILCQDVSTSLPDQMDFDYVFHFAGNASPHFISTDPVGILKSNIEGTFNMAEVCRRKEGSKLIFASTREVYGCNVTADSLNESAFGSLDPLDSRSCYPESKRAAESVIAAYHNQFGLRYDIVRIAHVYGPGMKLAGDGRVMSDFINNAMHKEPIRLNSDGTALRAFCYISDCIRALLLIAMTPEDTGVFNLSNETEEISVGELARTIGNIARGIEVTMRPQSPEAKALYCSYKRKALDCGKLFALGWRPEVKLRDGLERTLAGSVPD